MINQIDARQIVADTMIKDMLEEMDTMILRGYNIINSTRNWEENVPQEEYVESNWLIDGF